jgi:hypothetical protein
LISIFVLLSAVLVVLLAGFWRAARRFGLGAGGDSGLVFWLCSVAGLRF